MSPLSLSSLSHSNYRISLNNFPVLFITLTITLLLTLPVINADENFEANENQNSTINLNIEKRSNNSDPRRIMCGYQLIVNLKEQCGERGTYSPYSDSTRVRRGLRLHRATQFSKPGEPRRRKHNEFCSLYLRYEPYTIVTECCCRGCTRRFLEQYCAKE